MAQYHYSMHLFGIKDIDALPQAPHNEAELQQIVAESCAPSIPLSERTNWATSGESLGFLAAHDFCARADAALSQTMGKPVKIGYHIPFIELDAINDQTGEKAASYIVPAGVFTSATIDEGTHTRKILGPTFTVLFNTIGPMAAKREIPISTTQASDMTKQFVRDVIREMNADQLVVMIPNRKNHTVAEAKIDGAGMLFASMGAEPYLTTPSALPDDGDPNHTRENLVWVFDKNGDSVRASRDKELHKIVDGMFTQRIRGFEAADALLAEKSHYPHLGGGQFTPALFKDMGQRLLTIPRNEDLPVRGIRK